jgi:hypothetical protein
MVQVIEFKPQYHQKRKEEKERGRETPREGGIN